MRFMLIADLQLQARHRRILCSRQSRSRRIRPPPQYADQVYAITVGFETLYRGNFARPELLAKVQDTKKAVGGSFKVGTADSWNKYQDGTADALITGGVDILLCNAFSY